MEQGWHPSYWGKQATKCNAWTLTLDGDNLSIESIEGDGNAFKSSIGDIGGVRVNPGLLWSTIEIPHVQRRIRLRGIPNRRARGLVQALTAAKADLEHRIEVQGLIAAFEAAAAQVLNWVDELSRAAAEQLKNKGWLSRVNRPGFNGGS